MSEQTESSTIKDRVIKVVASFFKVPESAITLSTNWADDFNTESIDELELVMQLEEVFEYEIPAGDAKWFHTVQDVVSYLERHL